MTSRIRAGLTAMFDNVDDVHLVAEVPVNQARAFGELLGRVSTNGVVYVELPGGQHACDRASRRSSTA